MSDKNNVIPFKPEQNLVGDGIDISATDVLNGALKSEHRKLIVIAEDCKGNIQIYSTSGVADSVLLAERGKANLLRMLDPDDN